MSAVAVKLADTAVVVTTPPPLVPDSDASFAERWSAWLTRSLVHEARGRRKAMIGVAGLVALLLAGYALLAL